MSSVLPDKPSLEFLKKEAKDYLSALQQRNAGAQLSDAQHELARGYGFESWPKLKAHVESLLAPHPFDGTWVANVAKSTRHPYNQFQRATIRFAISGDTVRIIDDVVDAAGRNEHRQTTVQADGEPHEQQYGYVLRANWRSPCLLETEATKDGERVGWGKYELSTDGRELTISADQQVIVLEKQ